MKILLVHNDYGKPSGEEAVVGKMAEIYAQLGHDVAQLRRSTAGVRDSLSGKLRVFAAGLYCPSGVGAMREAIERERPDVVHVHNLFPFIGPAALRECRRAGLLVVMTVHNYRLLCPTGLFMRNDAPCELCLHKGSEWGCVRYNCENSLPKSIAYAARNWLARVCRHFIDCVDIFVCLTDFQRRKLLEAGFPASKLRVIPNTYDIPHSSIATPASEGSYVAFSGRLSREKGIDLILEAARRNPGIPFRLAGAARDPLLLENLPHNVSLEGHLSGPDYDRFIANARFLIMASRCYEGFPMAILEAAAHARPVIAPDHGGFSEIIGSGHEAIGRLFTPGDSRKLSDAIASLWADPTLSQSLGNNARRTLLARYTSAAVCPQWQHLLASLKPPFRP